jgi:hypothetical protein
MSSLIPGSCFIQEAIHLCFGFVFVGLAVAAPIAQSEEGPFAVLSHKLKIAKSNHYRLCHWTTA